MKPLDQHKGSLPLYVQLENIIQEEIESGKWQRGQLIPAEITYQNEYDVSRITVRQAIADLELKGYVERCRGRGTKVIWRRGMQENVQNIISMSAELRKQGREPGYSHVEARRELPPEPVRAAFDCEGELLHVVRVVTADGEPLVCFDSWLPTGRGLPESSEPYAGSLYALMDQAGVGAPVRVCDTLSAALADKWVASLLQVREGAPILVRQRVSYNSRNDVVEYTISHFDGEVYQYRLDLQNEKNINLPGKQV